MGSYEQSFAGGAEQGLTPLSRACFVSCQSLVLPELGRNPAPIAYQRREELHADDCQGAGHEKDGRPRRRFAAGAFLLKGHFRTAKL
jgi:hypothetical protein